MVAAPADVAGGVPFHFWLDGCCDAVDWWGIDMTAWQCGHLPRFPAFAAGTRSVFWQLAQTN